METALHEKTEYDVQIVIASGAETPCRAQLGFQTAPASMASELRVVVFLSKQGAFWGLKNPNGFQLGCVEGVRREIEEMIELLRAGGAHIEVCSACIVGRCSVRESDVEDVGPLLLDGIVQGGLTNVAIRSARVNTMVF